MPNLTRITVHYDDGAEIDVDLHENDSIYWTPEALEMLRPFYERERLDFDPESQGCHEHFPCCHGRICLLRPVRPPV